MTTPERVPISARFGRPAPEQKQDMVFVSQEDIEAARRLEMLEVADHKPMVIRREEVLTIDPRFLSQTGSGMDELRSYIPEGSSLNGIPEAIDRYLGRAEPVSDMTELHNLSLVEEAPHVYRPNSGVVHVGPSPEQEEYELDYPQEGLESEIFVADDQEAYHGRAAESKGSRRPVKAAVVLGAIGVSAVIGAKAWAVGVEAGENQESISTTHVAAIFDRLLGGDD